MNIVIITSIYPEPEDYGIQSDTKAIHYFTKQWVEQGNEVVVLHQYLNPVSRVRRRFKYIFTPIKYSMVDGIKVIFGEIQLYRPHAYVANKLGQYSLAKKISKFIKHQFPEFEPNYIIVHFPLTCNIFAEYFCKKSNCTCTMHGVDIRMLEKMPYLKRKKIIKKIESVYENVFFRSRQLMDRAKEIGFDTRKSKVIYSGIDENLLSKETFIYEKINNYNRSNTNIAYVGNLNEQKKVDVIIKALSHVSSNCRLQIIGDGLSKDSLELLTKKLKLENKVSFLGRVDREKVVQLLRKTDIFIMVSQNETFGLVYIEAMAQGCIAIGTKGEGIDGVIINEENGYLIEPNNPEKLASLIDKIISLPFNKRNKVILNGFNTACKMTDANMSKEYLNNILGISKGDD